MSLVDKVQINSPWDQYASGWIQNYTAAGLLAYASNTQLTYDGKFSVYNSLYSKFGSNGTDGTINSDLTNPDGFNSSLTLWALTVSKPGETPLQSNLLLVSYSTPSPSLHQEPQPSPAGGDRHQ
jgi:hypothetical protein